MITENEKNVLKMLLYAFGESYSINRIAKECDLAPNGALKILRKFEKESILKFRNIGNMKSYSLNFEDEKTKNILKLALIPELEGRLKYRAGDLKHLKELTDACIIFGSYADLKKEPNDIDLFFIIKDRLWMIPGMTHLRVSRSPIPDIGYFVNSDFLLESRGIGAPNMSYMGAERGVYDPAKILKNQIWSIYGLNI